MHATVSGCGDNLASDDADAIEQAKAFFSYLPTSWRHQPPVSEPAAPAAEFTADLIPAQESAGYDVHRVVDALVDADSFFEIKPLWAPELVVGFRRDGGAAGRHRGQQPGREGRSAVRRLCRQGGPVHLALRRLQPPAGLSGRRAGFHDRQRGRAAGDHPARRQDDHCGRRGDRADRVGAAAQGVRRRALCDVRPGLHAGRVHRAADREGRRDGSGGGDQRRLLQQDPGDRRPGRARGVRDARCARSTRRTSTSSASRQTW